MAISRFDAQRQAFVARPFTVAGAIYGADFPIRVGEGYSLLVREQTELFGGRSKLSSNLEPLPSPFVFHELPGRHPVVSDISPTAALLSWPGGGGPPEVTLSDEEGLVRRVSLTPGEEVWFFGLEPDRPYTVHADLEALGFETPKLELGIPRHLWGSVRRADGSNLDGSRVFVRAMPDGRWVSARVSDGGFWAVVLSGVGEVPRKRQIQVSLDPVGEERISGALPADAATALVPEEGGFLSEDKAPRSEVSVFSLFPNPFNAEIVIAFELSAPVYVRLAVHDLIGQQVAVLTDRALTAGAHRVLWDGRSQDGMRVASGVYLLQMKAGRTTLEQKAVLVR